jgi:hypothetical protein
MPSTSVQTTRRRNRDRCFLGAAFLRVLALPPFFAVLPFAGFFVAMKKL